MSLVGNLRTMSLPDILQWIAAGRKTGTLHVSRGSIQTRIVFKQGDIYSSWSNDPRRSMGQFLIRDRLVTEEQLFTTLLKQEQQGKLLGSILLGDGLLNEEQLKRVLRAKAEDTVYDLFLWLEGQFEFKDGEFPQELQIHVEMPVTAVVLEGIRRVDEWARIRKVFPSMSLIFKVRGAPQVEDPLERQALGLAAAGRTLAGISMELRRSEFETAVLFFDLLAREVVAVDKAAAEPEGSVDTVVAIRDLLALAARHVREKRYDQAMKAYEGVLALDRLNQEAKKGLIAVAEGRQRDRAARTIKLDKVPSLTMDLASLTKEKFDPQEGFVLSRVNGQWDVRSILKLCPMAEGDALVIFARLLERKVIQLR